MPTQLIKSEGYGEDPNIDLVGNTISRWINKFFKTFPLTLKGGTNGYYGEATLVDGTKTVANTSVKAGDTIMLSRKTIGGTAGNLDVGTITAGTSFVINSSSATDTSVVNWMIVRAAA